MNLLQIVTHSRPALRYALWGIVISGVVPMTGFGEELTPEELRQESLKGITRLSTQELTKTRRICMAHAMDATLELVEGRIGGGDIEPPAREYCPEAVRVGVTSALPFDPYVDMAFEQLQLKLPKDFAKGKDDIYQSARDATYEAVGSDNIAKQVYVIYLTADAGGNAYEGPDGKTHRITCPMALDAGATWLATRPNDPVRVPLTADEEARIVEGCYDPNVLSLPFRDYGNVDINALGLLLGENLGRRWADEKDSSALEPAAPLVPAKTSSLRLP